MNLQINCLGKKLSFEDISDLAELKFRLKFTEPSFLLETFTYQDEEDDTITLSNQEDFSCLLNSTIAIICAQGKYDSNYEQKKKESTIQLQKRLDAKLKYFKEQQKLYFLKRSDLYQLKLGMTIQQKNEIKDLKLKEKQLFSQILEQQQLIKQNEKLVIKITVQSDLDKTTIYEDILEAESKINYNEENISQFRKQIYLLEQDLCERFTQAYQIRLNKFITLKKRRTSEIHKLNDLKTKLKENQLEIRRKTRELNTKESYYIQKLMAVRSLLKKL